MGDELTAARIEHVGVRRILNSHLGFTNEFRIRLDNGALGVGASPQGETISTYEDRTTRSDTGEIIEDLSNAVMAKGALTQLDFDRFLQTRMRRYGRNNCWALSLAFFNALHYPLSRFWPHEGGKAAGGFPRLCLNILNGGSHAYTNPILSDFPEYLVVPKFDDAHKVIRDHAEIQRDVRENLGSLGRTVVNNNSVARFKSNENRECLVFLQGVLDRLDLSKGYSLMIDASAGDLRTENGYGFPLTDKSLRSTEALCEYWTNLIEEFDIGFLEDPFGEQDFEGWKMLAEGQSRCKIIGDNLYSSDAERIAEGSRKGYTHGVIIKPNQAGTVSAVRRAIDVSRQSNQIPITSHRSISTESTFLSLLTVSAGVGHMKIGPLYTDYTSVMRLNELIRLTGVDLA
jgi:enolase